MSKGTTKAAMSIGTNAGLALALIVLLGVALGAYAGNIEIAGAIVAGATAEVESYSKQIQHEDGGIVAGIYVQDDQQVQAGDLLVRIDDTELRASQRLIRAQLVEAAIEQLRFRAELAGEHDFTVPSTVAALDPQSAALVGERERQTLRAELASRDGKLSQLQEQVVQLGSEIDGLQQQRTAAQTQVDNITAELKGLSSLSDQKLILVSRVNDLEKSEASQEGEVGRLVAAIAETNATIAERRFQADQILSDFTSQALSSLRGAWETGNNAEQQLAITSAKLSRVEIRAPQAGVIHESQVHTIGGVITPGETIMQIVPVADPLVFRAHIDPNDIAQVKVGQAVHVRLLSFDRRATPEVSGVIADVSPDFVEAQGQKPYYSATVRLDQASMKSLPSDVTLQPGLPAEVFVVTGNRTVLSYLMHPLIEQLQLAMRDR